ncbi:hypothetical protein AN641_00295 [Candidatus Epulonipiscioides gigas]|nr:hypothetical protein AN641_00295 [Epulopiscium sp. SCG-C07WGA-EpuloA2]
MTALENILQSQSKNIMENGELNQRKLDSFALQLLELAETNKSVFAISALKDLIVNDKLDITFRIYIFFMLKRLSNELHIEFEVEKELYDFLVLELKKIIDTQEVEFLEKDKRKKNRVVIIVNQLVGLGSLDTNEFVKIAQCLNDNFEEIEEIYVINADTLIQEVSLVRKYKIGANINPNMKEDLQYILNQFKICRCGIGYYEKRGLDFIDRLAYFTHLIYKINPAKVIAINTRNFLAEIVNDFIEVYTVSYNVDDKDTNTQHVIVMDAKKAKREGTMELEEDEYYKKMLEYVFNS